MNYFSIKFYKLAQKSKINWDLKNITFFVHDILCNVLCEEEFQCSVEKLTKIERPEKKNEWEGNRGQMIPSWGTIRLRPAGCTFPKK